MIGIAGNKRVDFLSKCVFIPTDPESYRLDIMMNTLCGLKNNIPKQYI